MLITCHQHVTLLSCSTWFEFLEMHMAVSMEISMEKENLGHGSDETMKQNRKVKFRRTNFDRL